MVLPRPEPPGDCVLAIKLRPFLARPHLIRQRMTIEVNGAVLASFEEDNTEPSIKLFDIPSAVVAKGPELSMTFRTPDAARPADFGRSDTRKLSFAFHTMTVMPADKNPATAGSETPEEVAKPVPAAAGAV